MSILPGSLPTVLAPNWALLRLPVFYAAHPGLIMGLNGVAGLAVAFLYQTALYVCLRNARKDRFALTAAFLHSFWSVASIAPKVVLNHGK